jgi:hypothetical protein
VNISYGSVYKEFNRNLENKSWTIILAMKEQESIFMTLDCKGNWEREKESRRDCTHATSRNINNTGASKKDILFSTWIYYHWWITCSSEGKSP